MLSEPFFPFWNLHKKHLFGAAEEMYNLFLAQQDSVQNIYSIFVRFYATLASNHCVNTDEQMMMPTPANADSIRNDLKTIGKNNKYCRKLADEITYIFYYQFTREKLYSEVKEIFNNIPRYELKNYEALKKSDNLISLK